MGYGEELARVTIGSTTYVVHEDPRSETASYDIHAVNGTGFFRFFGTFDDSISLEEDALEKLIRNTLRIRTGIPG